MAKRKVLIVDDNVINRFLLRNILEEDYELSEAENGLEALKIMLSESRTLSAVLLDLSMPVMDGYAVLKKVAGDSQISSIPILVTTGNTDDRSEIDTLSLGAQDFITKPFNPEIIKHRLNNVIKLRETAATVNALQRDKLTNLYTRNIFFEKAAELIAIEEPGYYILACIDVDNFKVINDQYGSEKGDELLKYIAGKLRTASEREGLLCCRIAADNFAVLYPRQLLDGADLGECSADSDIEKEIPMNVTISIGRYVIDDKSLSVSAMYDRAMIAKASVKGRFDAHIAVYDESMRRSILIRQEIIDDMTSALENEQFEAWYQPQYNHANGALIGAEALARWRHPQKGLISPGDFIPVFEQNGFIYELDKFIWEQVCRQLGKWVGEGKTPLPISVNISRYDLYKSDLVEVITGLVKKYGIEAELLHLEITESAFAENSQVIIGVVERLINEGFIVEIDDFGSGYSSLNTLKDVPAQILKLDMRFLEGDSSSKKGGNILESVVRMAKWIGLSIIAEGVEDVKQADYLKSIGCSYVQGYLYAKPMPLHKYEEIIERSNKESEMFRLETVENLDNNYFWDPNSLDTLVFNSYVGAACIFEYRNDNIEVIRVTRKFVEMLGSREMTQQDAIRLNWMEHIDKANIEAVKEALSGPNIFKNDIATEMCFVNLPGCPEAVYVRANLRVIATAGDRQLVYCLCMNITEQKKAEQERKAALDRERTILNNLSSGVTAVIIRENREITPVLITKRYYELLGYTEEQFWSELPDAYAAIHPDDIDSVLAKVKEIDRERKAESIEFRAFRRDGKLIWLRDTISMTKFTGVDSCIQLSVFIDITEEKRRESSAAETSEQLRHIIENLNGGISAVTLVDGKLEYLFANEQYYKLIGYTEEQFKSELKNGMLDIVYPDDMELVLAAVERSELTEGRISFAFRVYKRDGSLMWLSSNSSICKIEGLAPLIHISVIYDVTHEKTSDENIRLREAEYRLAIEQSGGMIYRYIHETNSVELTEKVAELFGLPRSVMNVPDSLIAYGMVATESVEVYRKFYREMISGKPNGSMTIHRRMSDGSMKWLTGFFSTVYGDDGKPFSAIIMFSDITEQQEREAAYIRWQSSLNAKQSEAYTMVRWNLSRDLLIDSADGSLIKVSEESLAESFNNYNRKYAENRIFIEDRKEYISRLRLDTLLDSFYHDRKTDSFEYREQVADDEVRWIRLSVELMKYPRSDDVCAFIMYEDINEKKQNEIYIKQLAENDPLTGVLNRATFEREVNTLISESPASQHALIMLDIDGFKLLNDVFGHVTGDKVLVGIADNLRSILRHGDLLGRLGGDEFVIFMRDIMHDEDIIKKAKQICDIIRQTYNMEVQISASVGVTVYPRDGDSFGALYPKADEVLYSVKKSGKNNFALYGKQREDMNRLLKLETIIKDRPINRMLIVDDNEIDTAMLVNIFKGDFIIEKAKDGQSALIKLRHYGGAISVVLLDLMMPGIDGFEVLRIMQDSAEMRLIPVVVVSGIDDRETSLRAIKLGAADFVTKPIDIELIMLRVHAVVKKAENDKQRAKNSYIQMQSNGDAKFRTVLSNIGTVVVEHDWIRGVFTIEPSISRYIAGNYDGRKLWHVFLSDMVASANDVKLMQDLVRKIANDRNSDEGSMKVLLKTPSGEKHMFTFGVIKKRNEFNLAEKMILTFTDIEREALSN